MNFVACTSPSCRCLRARSQSARTEPVVVEHVRLPLSDETGKLLAVLFERGQMHQEVIGQFGRRAASPKISNEGDMCLSCCQPRNDSC